ncbi:hypothetical protein QQ045_019028 [Rhodiola kirilowii]
MMMAGGDTAALIDSATGYSISYSHLFPLVQSTAFGLVEMGIGKGDVVLILIPNSVLFPLLFFECLDAAILYSSGTGITGTSKGVVLSHRNLIATVELFVRFEASKYDELSSSNVYLAALPMFHILGLSLFVLGLLSLGSRVVVMSKFSIEAVRVIGRFKVTHFPVVPPILAALAAKAKDGLHI